MVCVSVEISFSEIYRKRGTIHPGAGFFVCVNTTANTMSAPIHMMMHANNAIQAYIFGRGSLRRRRVGAVVTLPSAPASACGCCPVPRSLPSSLESSLESSSDASAET